MKKTIKFLLALVMGAAMGSSAWAADNDTDTVKAGGTTKEFSWSYGAAKPRWYTLSKVSGDDCVTPQFAEAYSGQPGLSDGPQVTTKFTFTAKGDVTTRSSTTWKLWRCSAHATKEDTVPVFDPSQDDGGKPYSDRTDIWGDCGTYTITVEPADAVIPEDVAVIEGHTVRKTLIGGEPGTVWAASVTEGPEYVTLDTTSGTGEEFTCQIHGRAVGNGQVTVTKEGKPVAIYDVKVFDPAAVIHLCLGDVLTLNYNPGAKVWNKSQSSGLVVSTEGSMGQGTAGGEGTANPTTQSYKLMLTALAVGEEEVKLVNRNSSDTTWTTVDDIMIEVSQSREAMANTPVSVNVPGTTASAGSTTWATSVDPDGRATVDTSGTTASGATATVTGKEGGAATVTVKNVTGTNSNLKGIEFAMAFNFSTKPTEDGEAQYIKSGATVTLDDKDWTAGWTARSLDEGVATVTASGAAGTSPVVTGEDSGIAEIWVEDEDIRRVYQVHVQSARAADVTAYLGSTVSSLTLGSGAAAVWTATSDNEGVAKVSVPSGASDSVQPQITGVGIGKTTLTVRNDYCIWTLHVTVEDIPPAKLWATILKGQTGNATVDSDTDPMALILRYTTVGNSSLTIPEGYGAKADILAVGGGGGGGSGRSTNSQYGNGGNGGIVNDSNKNVSLLPGGSYAISVGDGGAGSSTSSAGSTGSKSSFSGTGISSPIEAAGGTGGTSRQSSTNVKAGTGAAGGNSQDGIWSSITGTSTEYGRGGDKGDATAATAAESNTGNGGKGGTKPSTGTGNGGKGGSGIVVIRITQLKALESVYVQTLPTVAAITYGTTLANNMLVGGSVTNAAGTAVLGSFAWVNAGAKPAVADSDKTEYGFVFTPNDTTTYKPLTDLKATVTVNKAAVTVTAANKSMTEGGTIPAFSATYNPNITPATAPKYSCAYSAGGAPGTYDIIPYGAADPNCTFTYAKGTLTVNAKSAGDLITTSGTVTKSTSGTTVIYKFTSGTGSLTVPANYKATADILVVGGGGGGGGTYNSGSTHQLGNGGNGGSVNHQNTAYSITASTLSITVGAGGTAGSSGSQGGQGGTSSVKLGSTTVASATGGTGGASKKSSASAGTPTNGTTIDNVTYGKGGAAGKGGTSVTSSWTASAGAANTGTGGQGGGNYYTKKGSYSAAVNAAAGGSGVVIIKITKIEALPQPALSDATAGSMTYGQALSTVSPIGAKMNINGTFAWDTDTTYKPTVAESGKQMFKATFTHSNASYWSPVSVLLAVTVSPKQLTDAMVALDPASFAYNGETQKPTVTVTDSEATITANDYTVVNDGGMAVGEYTVTVTGKGNYTGSIERKFTITRAPAPVKTWPGATEVYAGQTLGDSSLTNGVPSVEGEFAWADGTNVLATAGTFEFDVVFTPAETEQEKYLPVTNKVAVTVLPGVPVPTALALTYNGLCQTGVVEGIGYTLTDNTATNAGTYEARATLTVPGSCWAGGSSDPTNIIWSIAQKAVTVTGDSTSKVYGAADPTFTATVAGTNGFDGATIDYSVSRTNDCEDVGTYDIVPTGDVDQGNYLVSFVPGTFEITRKPIARPTATAELIYNGNCQTGVVAGVGYVLADNFATNAGTYTATATLDGNHMWEGDSTAAAEVEFTIATKPIVVTARNKTVKPGEVVDEYLYDVEGLIDPDTLTGALACGYDPETAKVGDTFDILQGSLTNANYTIETYNKGVLTVASLFLTFDPAGKVYDGKVLSTNDITFTVTDNHGNPVTEFLVEGPETMLNASNYEFKVTSGDLEGTAYFTVSQATVTVSAVSTNKVYSGDKTTDPELTATVVGTNGFDGAEISYTLTRAEGENVSEYAITASGEPSQGNYKVEFAPATFTIFPKGITVTANDATKTYGDPDPDQSAYSATITGTNGTDGATFTFTYSPESGAVDVKDDYALNVTGVITQRNYYVENFVAGKFSITPKLVTVTPVATNKVYSGDAATDPEPLPATVVGTNGTDGATIDYEVTRADGEDIGQYLMTVTVDQEIQRNYKVTTNTTPVYFTITPKPVTVAAVATNKVYSSADPDFTATVTGTIGSDTVSYTVGRTNTCENVGTYDIVPTGAAEQGNYTVTYEKADFTITPKPVTVKADDDEKTYGDDDPTTFAATVTGTNGTDGATIVYTISRTEGDVATNDTPYVITPKGDEEQGNYTVTFETGTFTINRKAVTVTADDKTKVFGDLDPELTATVPGLVGDDTVDYTVSRTNDCEDVGTYDIVPTGAEEQGNYTVSYAAGTLTIERRPILITVVETNKVYGAEDPAFTYVVSNAEGTAELKTLPNGTDVVLDGYLVRTAGEDVKDSPYDVDTLTYFNETNNPNYVFEATLDGENKFTILPAALLVQADDKSKLFGWDDPKWTATVTGLTNGDTKAVIDYKVECDHGEAVGKYPIVVSGTTPQGGAFGLNYDITYSNGWFEICAGKLSVTTNDVTRDYNDIDAAFAALLAKGGKAYFNEDVVFGGSTFAKGSTLTVGADGSWTTDGTLTLAEDICVGSVVAASNIVLTTDVTVGVTEEVTNELAILTFREIDISTNKLTLTTNGVVRSAEKLEIEKVFVEPSKAYEVVETAITDGWEYTAVLHGFTITFNSNGGSAVEPIVAPAGETVKGPEENPTRTGYGFDGWYTNNVMKVEFPLTMPMADFTLDAHWTTNRYEVVYDANGGTGEPAKSNATYDVTFAISGNPGFAKTGYSFNSWTNAAGDVFLIGAVTNNLTATDGDSVTLYAAWTPNVYTLVYAAGDGEGEDVETNLVYDVEHTVIGKPDDFAKTGYSFTGWTNLVDNLGYQPGDVVVNLTNEPNATVTWTAAWTANVYTITFNSNGGSVVAPIAAACDATIIAPAAPAKTGYAFQGWFTNNAESAYVFTTMPAGGLALTAKWAPNAYTVAYDPNGGEGASVTNGATYDAAFDIADCTFTKTGYTFGGWTTNVNVAVKFRPGDSVSNLTATAGATVKFYAAWTPNVYTLTYKAGEGTGKDIVSNMVYDVEYEVADCTFAKMGYSFKEWTNEVGTAYLPGQAIKNLTDVKGGNMDFTAVWTANVYTITFDTKGGSTVDPITAACDAPITEPADPTKTGYTFGGWTTNGVTVTFPATMPAGGLALTAKWAPNAYTVAYDPNGGTGDAATSNATYDVEFAISGNPGFAKTGYTFNSWTNAEGTVFAFSTATNNLTATAGGSVELYAKWMPNAYTLIYTAGDGEGEDVETNLVYDVEHTVIGKPDDFEKTGYSFAKWTDEEGEAYLPGDVVKNLTNEPNAVVTWTAAWTANVYQVTFDSAGGTPVGPIVAKYGAPINAPDPAPTREWYTFKWWFENDSETAYTFTTMPAGGVALTAKWSADPGNPENPWTVGPADNPAAVKAYFDPELGTVVIDFVETNVIDLVALTNGLAEAGVTVDPEDFNAVVKIRDSEFVTPAGWLDADDPEDPDKFNTTLGGALEDGIGSVAVCETEPPAEIIETREVEVEGSNVVVTAVVVNDPSGVETNAIQVTAVEGLAEIAEGQKTDVTLRVAATNKNAVGEATVWALMSANTNGLENVSGYQASYVDLSAKFGDDPVTDFGEGNVVTLFIPWTVDARFIYRIARIHNGEPEPIPEGEANQNDFGEYFELAEDGVILHARRFSTYAFAEIVAELSGVALIEVDDADKGVREGTNLVIRVTGGNRDFSSSVQLQVVYGTAVSSDFDLKNTKVNGAIDTAFKFPYTLTWEKGALGEQTIEIPVKVPSKPKAERDLTFELQNPMNLTLEGVDRLVANKSYRKVTILGGLGPVSDKVYVRAVPNDATRGKTSGSALVVPGKKVTVKATANKGYAFTGWEGLEGLGSLEGLDSRSASISFSAPTNSVDLVARFEPLAADYLELTDDFLPAELKLGEVFSNAVSVASDSLPTITVSGLPAGLKYYAKETLVKATKTTPAYTVPANTIYGIPTKKTTAKVKVTVKNLGGYKITRTYEVKVVDDPQMTEAKILADDKPFAAVTVALSDDAAGKVTGAGLYQAGKKVTLKATANKGYVFAEWLEDGVNVSSNASYVIASMPSTNVSFVAKFVLPDEIPDPTGKAPWGVAVVRNNDFAGTVTGAGYYQQGKKVTVKATANKGYVFNGWYEDAQFAKLLTLDASLVITAMPANNVRYYAVFVTAAEDYGSIETTVNGMALTPGSGKDSASPLPTNVMCGVYLEWPVAASALSLPKVAVSGLPSGLKFAAKPVTAKVNGLTVTNVQANTIYGAPTAESKKDKSGNVTPSKVKVTVTTAGKSKAEYQIDVTVDPLPDYAVGTFDGPVFAADGATNGVVKLTVAKTGKISGTVQTNCTDAAAKKLTLSAASFADFDLETGVFALVPTYKDGKETVELPLTLSAAAVDGGTIGAIDGEPLVAYQNVLKGAAATDFNAPTLGAYTNLTLTVQKDGVLKMAGKVLDNSGKLISASGSSQIYYDTDEQGYRAVIYLPSKKGFDGVAEVIEVKEPEE